MAALADRDGRGDRDHDRARAAVQAGDALPLPVILGKVQQRHPGQVLDVELERDDGRWVYEIRLLQADGALLKLHVDARDGQTLRLRRRDEGGRGRHGRDD